MAEPLQYRYSNSSDDSPLQEDPSDSEHESTPLEDHDEVIEPLDPRNSQLSLVSGAGHSLDDRRHQRRRDFDRHSLTHRDFFKYLVEEGSEAKKLRKVLRAALERLDGETRRAQEAERRALELAQRFKIVNEARVSSQQELDRVHTELRMYKVQLDNAQREILRGSDLLKDIESQRDSAEASAARARSTARKLKEEQLMMRAREEGRREGYQEGLRRAYQQVQGVSGPQLDVPPAGLGPLSGFTGGPVGTSGAGDLPRTEPLDGFSMMNLSTPPPAHPALPSFGAALQDGSGPADLYGAGAQGSRFRENIGSPSTFQSAPLGTGSQAEESSGWPAEEVRYIRPTTVYNASPSPKHADYPIPPDGYVPSMGADSHIPIPPPHELHNLPSISSIIPPNTLYSADDPRAGTIPVNARDYAYTHQRHRSSPRSLAESLPSTTISQFDLVSTPNAAVRGVRERSSGLSAIPEVSSSMEFSPGTEGRVRSTILPEPTTFPVTDDRGPIDIHGNDTPGRSRSRSRETNQRIADELRYSDPDLMEQWRRSTASQSQTSSSRERLYSPHRPAHITTPSPLGGPPIPASPSAALSSTHRRSRSVQSPPSDGRSYLGASHGSGNHRRTASSTPISIHIEPPSGPGSNISPASIRDGMLSPDASHQPLPPQPAFSTTPTPDRPHSRGYAGGSVPYGYSASNPRPQSPYYNIPPSQTLTAASSPRNAPDPLYPHYSSTPSSSSVQGRPHSRSASADFTGRMGDLSGRPRTPSTRPPSALASERLSTRPVTPGQPYPAYPATSPSVPSVLRSPSRTSSRQSFQPEPARPASRTSADPRRGFSLHAGSTPAMVGRPLSGASQIRRVPSASSIHSETSRKSGGYQHYDPQTYVDAAFLASTEDLSSMQSPNTFANTRANAVYSNPGPSRLRASSPSVSYTSLRS